MKDKHHQTNIIALHKWEIICLVLLKIYKEFEIHLGNFCYKKAPLLFRENLVIQSDFEITLYCKNLQGFHDYWVTFCCEFHFCCIFGAVLAIFCPEVKIEWIHK